MNRIRNKGKSIPMTLLSVGTIYRNGRIKDVIILGQNMKPRLQKTAMNQTEQSFMV